MKNILIAGLKFMLFLVIMAYMGSVCFSLPIFYVANGGDWYVGVLYCIPICFMCNDRFGAFLETLY